MSSVAANPGQAYPSLSPTQALLRGFEFAPEPTAVALLSTLPSTHVSITGPQVRQGFRIGSLNLMIRYADGSELADVPPIYRLPNAPAWMLGMVNLHGALVPVFDLARWFDHTRASTVKPMLLVLGQGADAAGVVIDGLPERLRWSSEQLCDPGLVPEALAEVAPSAVLIDSQLWFDLDRNVLLAEFERALGASQ
jgi:twitching motility protein PilI